MEIQAKLFAPLAYKGWISKNGICKKNVIMKKITMILIALAISTIGLAQGLPKSAALLSASGSLNLKSGGTNYLAVSAGTINHMTGNLYLQPRLGLIVADQSALSLAVVPTLTVKSWTGATLYAGIQGSAFFTKGQDAYLQASPEVGMVCSIGKSALSVVRLNYDLKDNSTNRIDLAVGIGFRL